MTTLKDVAELANVSIATVSYVINGSKKVTPKTRFKVMAAIEELNYIPNTSARKMREVDSKEIGVIFPQIDDPYFSEILQGIIQQADLEGYSINIAFSYSQPSKELKIIQDFIGRNVSGIIIVTCQPDNTDFFKNNILRYQIPSVFIDRLPQGLDVNFIAFDNYSTVYSLTEHLIESGYERLSLFTGGAGQFNENECISAFVDAHEALGQPYQPSWIHSCNMTKEDAFRVQMESLLTEVPQVIISSAETITIGITEALSLCHIRIPQDVVIITLGIESWHSSNYHPGTLRTSRRAYTLGKEAASLLIQNILQPAFFETKYKMHQDNFTKESYKLPEPPAKYQIPVYKKTLRILAAELPTIHALKLVSRDFCANAGINIQFDYLPISELFKGIYEDSHKGQNSYDIYMFDIAWLNYLVREQCLQDLTAFITSRQFDSSHIIEKNLKNCNYKGRYYGLPIIGGTHLLFYRKDIFENIRLQQLFQEHHHIPLRPPRTWAEFNGIAEFFTKSLNPESPTKYGTSIPGYFPSEMFLEILVRLWGHGGGLYDQNNRLILNSPANFKGFQSILDTCNYIPQNPLLQKTDQVFEQFANGDIAMFLSFTEYASPLKSAVSMDTISKIGYAAMPSKVPANVGWNLGISPSVSDEKLILEYFRWVCQKNISYYMTILDGQSVMDYPYHNHELLKLYPWLGETEAGIALSHTRLYPYEGKSGSVPPHRIEAVLCGIFQNIYRHSMPIQDALNLGQKEVLQLYQ